MAEPRRLLPLAVRQQIKELRYAGATVREVAKQLDINRNTASKYGRNNCRTNR